MSSTQIKAIRNPILSKMCELSGKIKYFEPKFLAEFGANRS